LMNDLGFSDVFGSLDRLSQERPARKAQQHHRKLIELLARAPWLRPGFPPILVTPSLLPTSLWLSRSLSTLPCPDSAPGRSAPSRQLSPQVGECENASEYMIPGHGNAWHCQNCLSFSISRSIIPKLYSLVFFPFYASWKMQRLGRIATWMALREEPGTTFALCPAVAHRSSIFCGVVWNINISTSWLGMLIPPE